MAFKLPFPRILSAFFIHSSTYHYPMGLSVIFSVYSYRRLYELLIKVPWLCVLTSLGASKRILFHTQNFLRAGATSWVVFVKKTKFEDKYAAP